MQLIIYQNGCKTIGFSNGKGQSAKINSVKLKEFRDLKELYLQFNARNGGNPSQAQIELEKLIETYRKSRHEIFREFASLLEKYKSSIKSSGRPTTRRFAGQIASRFLCGMHARL